MSVLLAITLWTVAASCACGAVTSFINAWNYGLDGLDFAVPLVLALTTAWAVAFALA